MPIQQAPSTNIVSLTNFAKDRNTQPDLSLQGESVAVLQTVLESLTDGVLIVTETGEEIYANRCARQLCAQLNSAWMDSTQLDGNSAQGSVPPHGSRIPKDVWQACQVLIQPRDRSSRPAQRRNSGTIEVELSTPATQLLKARITRLELPEREPYLLIMLEDCHQSLQNLALAEVKRYNLTAREAEIWILRRSGLSYNAIAAQLYISLNTVKKHLKNIHAKREDALALMQTDCVA